MKCSEYGFIMLCTCMNIFYTGNVHGNEPAEPVTALTDSENEDTSSEVSGATPDAGDKSPREDRNSLATPSHEDGSDESIPEGSSSAKEPEVAEAVPAAPEEADDVEEIEEVDEIEVIEAVDASEEEDRFFPRSFDDEQAIRRDRAVNVLTARPVRKNSLTFIIDHRPYKNLFNGEDVFFDYLGLDGGNLKVGLGLRYGIIDGLDVGVSRLSDGNTVAFDTYEFDVRYAFLNQEKHHLDASVRAGVSWFAQKNRKDDAGGFGEVFVDRVFFDMLLVGVGFAFHSESSSDSKAQDDDAYSGAVLGVLEWRMINSLAFSAEVAANVFGYGEKWPAMSFAIKVLTHRHTFSLILSNTQFILSDGIVANSWRDFSNIVFGFRIIREFNF